MQGDESRSSASPYTELLLQISHKTRFSKLFAQSKKSSCNIALRRKGEGEEAVIFLIAALAVAITHHRNTSLPSLVGLVSSVQLSEPEELSGELLLASQDTSAHIQVIPAEANLKNTSQRPLGKYSRRSSSLPCSCLEQLLIPWMGTFPGCAVPPWPGLTIQNRDKRRQRLHFVVSFQHPRAAGWSASFSIVEIKCWDHAGDGNIPQILHGVY